MKQYFHLIPKNVRYYSVSALVIVFVFVGVWFTSNTASGVTMAERTLGKIVLQVEQNGEAWYVYPSTQTRFYLGRPSHAFDIMRYRGLGITDADLSKIPVAGSDDNIGDMNLQQRLAGYILLQVEQNGEAWYVYPNNLMRYYLGRPDDAYDIMRNLGLGIADDDLTQINIDSESMELITEESTEEEEESEEELDPIESLPDQTPPVIYLPFPGNRLPDGLLPMGETIEHDPPKGHSGIDYAWEEPSTIPKIRASMKARVTKIEADTSWPGTWDVATQNGIYGVDYTELGSLNPDLEVGDLVRVGDFIGYPWQPNEEYDMWMIHWSFGIADYREAFQGYVDLHLCPMTYFADDDRETLQEIWDSLPTSEIKENAPYLCSNFFEGLDDPSGYE